MNHNTIDHVRRHTGVSERTNVSCLLPGPSGLSAGEVSCNGVIGAALTVVISGSLLRQAAEPRARWGPGMEEVHSIRVMFAPLKARVDHVGCHWTGLRH